MGHIEFGNGRTKGRPLLNTVNLYIYVAGGIIEWDFCGTDKEEIFDEFWLYSRRRNCEVIIDDFSKYFYGFKYWNVSKKVFNIK